MILDNTIPFNQHSFKFFPFFTIYQNAENSGKDFIIWVTVVPHQSGSACIINVNWIRRRHRKIDNGI